MKKYLALFSLLAMSCTQPICFGQSSHADSFSMRNFSSSSIPVFATYDSIIAIFGKPKRNCVRDNYRIERTLVNEERRHSFKEIYFPKDHVAYLWVEDSVELLSITFDGPTNMDTLYYNNQPLCKTVRMEEIAQLLGLDEAERQEAFQPIDNSGRSSKATTSLMYFGDPNSRRGYVEFLFDKAGFLLGLYFGQPDGSLVYKNSL